MDLHIQKVADSMDEKRGAGHHTYQRWNFGVSNKLPDCCHSRKSIRVYDIRSERVFMDQSPIVSGFMFLCPAQEISGEIYRVRWISLFDCPSLLKSASSLPCPSQLPLSASPPADLGALPTSQYRPGTFPRK